MKHQMVCFKYSEYFEILNKKIIGFIKFLSFSSLGRAAFSYFNQLRLRSSAVTSLIGLDINPNYVALAEISITSSNNGDFSLDKDKNNNSNSRDRDTRCHYELRSFALVPIASRQRNDHHNYFNKDMISSTREAIALAFAKANPKTRKTVIALSHSMVNSKTIMLQHRLPEHAIGEFLKLNSEKYFGVDEAAVSFDYRVLSKSLSVDGINEINAIADDELETTADKNKSVLQLVATDRKNINMFQDLVVNTELDLIAIDVDVYALIRAAVLLYPELEEPYAVIHLDSEKIMQIIVGGGVVEKQEYHGELGQQQSPFFTGEKFIDDVARQSSVTLAQFILKQLQPMQPMLHGQQGSGVLTILLCGTNDFISTELVDAIMRVPSGNKENMKIKVIIANPFKQKQIKLASHLQARAGEINEELNKIALAMMLGCGLALWKWKSYA